MDYLGRLYRLAMKRGDRVAMHNIWNRMVRQAGLVPSKVNPDWWEPR